MNNPLSKLTCVRNRLTLKNLLQSWHFLSPELRSYLISLAENSVLCVSLNGYIHNIDTSENRDFFVEIKGNFPWSHIVLNIQKKKSIIF